MERYGKGEGRVSNTHIPKLVIRGNTHIPNLDILGTRYLSCYDILICCFIKILIFW